MPKKPKHSGTSVKKMSIMKMVEDMAMKKSMKKAKQK
jgi:hypothetical protein